MSQVSWLVPTVLVTCRMLRSPSPSGPSWPSQPPPSSVSFTPKAKPLQLYLNKWHSAELHILKYTKYSVIWYPGNDNDKMKDLIIFICGKIAETVWMSFCCFVSFSWMFALADMSSVILFGACVDGVVLRDKWVCSSSQCYFIITDTYYYSCVNF